MYNIFQFEEKRYFVQKVRNKNKICKHTIKIFNIIISVNTLNILNKLILNEIGDRTWLSNLKKYFVSNPSL